MYVIVTRKKNNTSGMKDDQQLLHCNPTNPMAQANRLKLNKNQASGLYAAPKEKPSFLQFQKRNPICTPWCLIYRRDYFGFV